MKSLFVITLLIASAASHCTFWHPSVFMSDQQRNDQNAADNANPLENMTFKQWWWHQNLDFTPKDTMEIPANGEFDLEISQNKAHTTMGRGLLPNPRNAPNPWSYTFGNLHAPQRTDVSGCAIGIAYKSNQHDVQPEDFVIFSVVHDCPARQLQTFEAPNLPACPNGRCMCSWFWIHRSVGGSDQMYMTPFACNVTNVKSDASHIDVKHAQPPRKCVNPDNCIRGPRLPMYWSNLERNNMPERTQFAPTYSTLYGFDEGRQTDIFVNTNPTNTKSKPAPAENKCSRTDVKFADKNKGSRLTTKLDDGVLLSPNCEYSLNLQGSNLLLQNTNGDLIWQSASGNHDGHFYLSLPDTGKLSIVSNSTGDAVWSIPHWPEYFGQGPYRLDLTDDGQAVIFDGSQTARWESFRLDGSENNLIKTVLGA